MRFALIIFCLASFSALARPVSYPGGLTLMQMNDGNSNSLHIHYSPNAKSSIGYKGEYWQDAKWQFHGLQYNYLLKRWNGKASQANIYLKNGIGIAHKDEAPFSNKFDESAFSGLAMDIEDRRFFASYENRYVYAGDIDKFYMHKARVGVAPYIGDYGDLHSWLMIELTHNPTNEGEEINITPLLRIFKGVYMFEAGMSFDGEILVNGIIRF